MYRQSKLLDNNLRRTIFGRLFWNNHQVSFNKYKFSLNNYYKQNFHLGNYYQGKIHWLAIKNGSTDLKDWSMQSNIIIANKPCITDCKSLGIITETVKIFSKPILDVNIELLWNNEAIDVGNLPEDLITSIVNQDKNELKYISERLDERMIKFYN
jgi:hypothetical protein